MFQQLVFAARVVRRTPVAAAAAITSIALGIAASTAVFSVTEAILLRPLPYANPERLVVASAEMRKRNTRDLPLSGPDFLDLRASANASFEDFAAVLTGRTLLSQSDGTLEQIRFAAVSSNFFRVLGRPIALGRDFADADGEPLPANAGQGVPLVRRASTVAILSHEYWLRRFGGDSGVLGQRLETDGGAGARIVGVLAPGAELIFPPALGVERLPDVWLSARIPYDATQRAVFAYRVVGRLKEGVAIERAQAEVAEVAAGLRSSFPLWQSAEFGIVVDALDAYVAAEVEPAILTLLGAALCLLLIACANVANLLLVQASYREREFAVRSSLGAMRSGLIRQMLVQALLLAGIATATGTTLAWVGLPVLLSVAPANLPRVDAVAFNAAAFGFALILGLAAAGVAGILPALRGSRADVMALLRTDGRTPALGVSRWLRGVLVVQIAVSFVLLIGSGLMLRSFAALQRFDPGFDADQVLTFQVIGVRQGALPEQRQTSVRDIYAALDAIPGVRNVTSASPYPLAEPFYPIRWGTDGALVDESRFQAADYQVVLPGYFDALKTRLIAGRTFTDADNAPERGVVIVDRLLAEKAFGSDSAVGKRLLVRIRTAQAEWVDVIGVVAHQRASSLTEVGREQIYFTDGFLGHGATSRWAIRTSGPREGYEGAVRAAIAGVSRQLVVAEMQPMDALVQRSQARTRFSFILIAVLASIAAVLAAVGLYGVLSTIVRQRTIEVGARMALGAEPRSILTLILRQGLLLSVIGITIGFVGALLVTRLMSGMLVAVEPTDSVTFLVTACVYMVVAALACLLPARRAANLNPVVALRGD